MEQHLYNILQKRKAESLFRTLKADSNSVDFSSNNYLGFSNTNWRIETTKNGATGSRLISGHSEIFNKVEQQIATFHNTEAALIFNSGYDANLGFFSCVPQKGDTVIYDALCHASIRDGLRLGLANNFSFKHNDIADLEKKILKASGNIFIVIESIYSMDGDEAPLEKIVAVCEKYTADIILDEAHATGVLGENGEGLAQSLNLESKIFARVHTFGKAMGCHGAIVLGSKNLRKYLINFARSFIYTTALSEHSLNAVESAYDKLKGSRDNIDQLHQNISLFQSLLSKKLQSKLITSSGPIQSILVPENETVKKVEADLQSKGFDIRAILHPTVEEGKERLRICIHSFNTEKEIKMCVSSLEKLVI